MKFLKATAQQHLDKAARNEHLSSELQNLSDGYAEWQIITVFYAAVHLVQAYLRAKTTEYPQTHAERDQLIVTMKALNPIYKPYQELKHMAVTARYACLPTNGHDVREARKQLAEIQTYFDKVLK